MIFRHSEDGKKQYNGVRYKLNTVRLCDGGYEDTLNHDAIPIVPPNCQKELINMSSINRSSTQRGNGIFKTQVPKAIFEHQCNNAYIIVGFDAAVFFAKKKGNKNEIVSKITRLNNHLRPCDNLLGSDCNSFYHRIDFNANYQGPTQPDNIELDIIFSGSESIIPIPNFQFICNLSENCGKFKIPQIPNVIDKPPKREILNDIGLGQSIGTDNQSENQVTDSSSYNTLEYEAWHSAVIHIMINDIAVTNSESKSYSGPSNSAEMIEYGCTCRTLLPFEERL